MIAAYGFDENNKIVKDEEGKTIFAVKNGDGMDGWAIIRGSFQEAVKNCLTKRQAIGYLASNGATVIRKGNF